jgi:hypothetical protein
MEVKKNNHDLTAQGYNLTVISIPLFEALVEISVKIYKSVPADRLALADRGGHPLPATCLIESQ